MLSAHRHFSQLVDRMFGTCAVHSSKLNAAVGVPASMAIGTGGGVAGRGRLGGSPGEADPATGAADIGRLMGLAPSVTDVALRIGALAPPTRSVPAGPAPPRTAKVPPVSLAELAVPSPSSKRCLAQPTRVASVKTIVRRNARWLRNRSGARRRVVAAGGSPCDRNETRTATPDPDTMSGDVPAAQDARRGRLGRGCNADSLRADCACTTQARHCAVAAHPELRAHLVGLPMSSQYS